jgi:hypothetical protein
LGGGGNLILLLRLRKKMFLADPADKNADSKNLIPHPPYLAPHTPYLTPCLICEKKALKVFHADPADKNADKNADSKNLIPHTPYLTPSLSKPDTPHPIPDTFLIREIVFLKFEKFVEKKD